MELTPQNKPDIESGDLASDVTKVDAKADEVDNLVKQHDVMLFSKTFCVFSLEMKRMLTAYGIPFTVFEVDKVKNAADMTNRLNEISGIKTFPNLFIKGKSVGGCMDCKRLEHNGQFLKLFGQIPRIDKQPETRLHSTTFFWFPETINRHTSQAAGLIAMIICVLCVTFWKRRATKWVILALAADFFGRILFGGSVTPIGMLSTVFTAYKKPTFMAGAPKQFAAFCGFFMSCLAAGLLLADQRLGGTIVVGCLIFPTALEGVFDFCLGCWMFGWGIRLGLLPKSLYRPYLTLFTDKEWAYNFAHEERHYPEAKRVHVLAEGQTVETEVDLIRKDRYETEYKLQDVHVIKHARVELFAWPMAIAALALVFKLTGETYTNGSAAVEYGNWGTRRVGQALGITSAVLFCIFAVFYVVRIYLYTKKVVKEWRHPITGNFFSAINICVTIYGYMMYNNDLNFGIALVWIASCFQMFIAVEKIASLVFDPTSDELLNPSIMMSPVSNFVCAFGFANYQSEKFVRNYDGAINYVNLGRLWFAVAALFAIIMFAVTFNKAIRDHHSDVRLRPTLFIWMATAAVAGPSYYSVSGDSNLLYQCLWLIAVFFFAVNIIGYLKGFYSYVQDMSIFIYSFSYCALAFSTFHYYVVVGGDQFTRVLSIIALALATTSVAVSSFHAVYWAEDHILFRPKPKWGPVNFMKLTHEAFRFGLPKIVAWLESIDETSNPAALAEFVNEMESVLTTYLEHGNHEESVLFPAVNRYFPGFIGSAHHEHEEQHVVVEKMSDAIQKWRESTNAGTTSALISVLKAELPNWSTHVLEHLRHEEAGISVVARKYFPLDVQKRLTEAVFTLTPIEKWYLIIPFTLKNLAMPMWKAQFLRTFIWANPSRAQEIGLIVYRTVDSVTWASLAEEIPEMIPRGNCGFRRAY